jgi:glutamate/tyrosine decarboxylase-like PLP-dependent enzyme
VSLESWLSQAVAGIRSWESGYPPFAPHDSTTLPEGAVEAALAELIDRLGGNYPFFHPSYAGQMLKPPHPAAVASYLAAMLINPNNHALDGGPPTSQMEKESVAAIAGMFGLREHLGHLASGGTVANLEALFIARELRPGKAIAFSSQAHYTHARMSHLLGVEAIAVPAGLDDRIDLDALEALVSTGGVGTVVLTAGTTGRGAVDAIDEAIRLRDQYGVRIHVDAAYGGFHRVLADTALLSTETSAALRAIAQCDSVVVDPHKQGLQPYGCGAVLFADPSVGRFFAHDSPYTYFTSDELHLGEISLECSRPGAAAAALWLTLRLFPLTVTGLGAVLAAGRRAADHWQRRLEDSAVFCPLGSPALDIVTYRQRSAASISEVDASSHRIAVFAMNAAADPLFLSTLRVDADVLVAAAPSLEADVGQARVLRTVLMKPEAEDAADQVFDRLESLALEAVAD